MVLSRIAAVLTMGVIWAQGDAMRYELHGRLLPPTRASICLQGAMAPFEDSTLSDDGGHFRFHNLAAGAYTLAAFMPGQGELRRTIEVGPSQADAGRHIELTIEMRDAEFESRDSLRRANLVSARELAIPESARREYEEAEKKLARRDAESAEQHFERAVELAPNFSAAWNHLGTIAYQSRNYAHAESCFRKALDADPAAFQPLVNLGGVTINLGRFEESLKYNLFAALARPEDALANSQLGMSYFYLNKFEPAKRYLDLAKRLDPAHFSHPQLLLAQIDLRRGERQAAAGELAEFLQYHPDAAEAGKVKEQLAQLRADPSQAFASTGMAQSFSEQPELPPFENGRYIVVRRNGRSYLQTRTAQGDVEETRIDAAVGSRRHARVLLTRKSDGTWQQLPLALLAGGGGGYVTTTFSFSERCLGCHARQAAGHLTPLGCVSCHGVAGSAKPGEAVCLTCHPATRGPESAHAGKASSADQMELNSAGYRLLESRCYRVSAGKLTCVTCHPPHGFTNTSADFRGVCRTCHADAHNRAALDCTRCHMPKRDADDVPGLMVTDHRIQRPL